MLVRRSQLLADRPGHKLCWRGDKGGE